MYAILPCPVYCILLRPHVFISPRLQTSPSLYRSVADILAVIINHGHILVAAADGGAIMRACIAAICWLSVIVSSTFEGYLLNAAYEPLFVFGR